MTRQRTFIIPTRMGFVYALICLLFFIASYVYENNLFYLYTFILVSIGHSSMYLTNRNIDKAQLRAMQAADGFVGDEIKIKVDVQNTSNHFLRKISFGVGSKISSLGPMSAEIDLEPSQIQTVEVPFLLKKRGLYLPPALRMQSIFPMRILLAWKVFKNTEKIWTYPARSGIDQFPLAALERGQWALQEYSKKAEEDFRGFMKWESSHSFRKIDWKVKARTGLLMMQDREQNATDAVFLHWSDIQHLPDVEAQLSQLSLWIDVALKENKMLGCEFPDLHCTLSPAEVAAPLMLRYLAQFGAVEDTM